MIGSNYDDAPWVDRDGTVIEESDSTAPDPLAGMVSAAWLDSQQFPTLEWAIEGVIPEGFGFIVAPPKAGKSWFVGGVGIACASGGWALGKIGVTKRPVLYFALEDGHRRLQSRFRSLTHGEPLPSGLDVIINATSNQVLAMMCAYLERHEGEQPLVILDTFGKVKPDKKPGQDPYIADYKAGSALKECVDRWPGASLLVVHHSRKVMSGDFVDAVSGTQGIAGSADYILVLDRRRNEGEATLSVTGRDVNEAVYALKFEDNGQWVLDGMDLADAAETVRKRHADPTENVGDRSRDVIDFVKKHPDGVTPKQVDEALGITNARVYLSRMSRAGHVEKASRGKYTPVTSVSTVTSGDETGSPSMEVTVETDETLFGDVTDV